MSKYARRTDNNHAEFAALFKHLDYKYVDTHNFPGMLDYIVRSRRCHLVWFEIKSSPDEPLTEAEQRIFEMFPLYCHKVVTTQQAADIMAEIDEDELGD